MSKLKVLNINFFFWILYFVTIITVAQIVACIIIFIKYYNKSGEIGPRGFEGKIGDKGDKGKCEQAIGGINNEDCGKEKENDCDYHKRLIKIMIQKIYEKEKKEALNKNEIDELNKLLSNDTYENNIKNINKILGKNNGEKIKNLHELKYSELRRLHSHITIEASKNKNITTFIEYLNEES